MPDTDGERREAALRRKLAIDVRTTVAAVKAHITAGTEDAQAQTKLDQLVARTRTIAR